MAAEILDEVGMLDLEQLFKLFPRLKLVDKLAGRHPVSPLGIGVADVFYERRGDGEARGGFDLVVGNPPWVKVGRDARGVLGEFDPVVVVQKCSPREASKRVEEGVTADLVVREAWFGEMEATEATQKFLNAVQNYPLLRGQQTNLYKCFLPQTWRVGSQYGV